MAQNAEELAGKVVGRFRELLGDEICDRIGDQRFHDLHAMVRKTLTGKSAAILECLEDDLARSGSELAESYPQ